ncbi:MAG TPA: hypothetical protein VGT04_08560 [Acidobacteriaceae bacterium]|nr:hypothetical protein [Acidobacteriaceae bacterium]
MRFVLVIAVAALVSLPQAFAANTDKIPDEQELTALEARAEHATPKEQCYLYAKLVQDMADETGRQLDAGNDSGASASLKAIQRYTEKIGREITDHARKLKDAQIMMRRTAFRLQELMRGASVSDQAEFQSTLKQMDQVQSQMMLAVFKK